MADETVEHLTRANELVEALCADAPEALRPRLDELARLLAEAGRRGEGQEAHEIRQQMERLVQTNAQFVSVMAHEIRIPMTSIRGYADMLAKNVVGELNPMQLQFAETIRNNVIRMEQLVSDVSDISKLHSGRIRLEAKQDSFASVIERVQKEVEALAQERGHSVTYELAPDLPPLHLDSARLAQVIGKLLVNALRYTPEGGAITVRAQPVDGQLAVTVEDTGIGIAEDERAHIGDLFWRSDRDEVRAFKGNGLGLPIAMGLVKLLGGSFFFHGAAGKGSTFGFRVPPGAPA